jgi:phage-related protein (TIGR01555 family)
MDVATEVLNAKTEAQAWFDSEVELVNSLGDIVDNFGGAGLFAQGSSGNPSIQTDGLMNSNRWYLVSNMRPLVTQMYVEHGIVQTLIDQPVDDAYRAGFTIKTSQLDADDIEKLHRYMEKWQVIEHLKQARKYARLYGGGGLLLITNTVAETELDIKKLKENDPIEFRACDMWELYYSQMNVTASADIGMAIGENQTDYYNYYGRQVHKSRVLKITGKEAPSFIRPRLRGWGMSELERLITSLNQYIKNQALIFELLDQAKIDVYHIEGLSAALMTPQGSNAVHKRLAEGNQLKSFTQAIVMDKEDGYEQKQLSFGGLSEILLQIRQGIAADLKMPMTKLFGISSAGFSSGEDDIENYNSMIEAEIRSKDRHLVAEVVGICSQKLFGIIPDDLLIEWNPLRILNAKEEEEVKNSQLNRTMSIFQSGLATAQEAKQAINKDSLICVELDETSDALPPVGGDFVTGSSGTNVDGNVGNEGKKNSKRWFGK